MNKSYLHIIIAILFLGISNGGFAQKRSNKSGEFQLLKKPVITQGFPVFFTEDNYPEITFSSNTNSALTAHNLVVQAEIKKYEAWLKRQKDVFKKEIQQQLGQNFSDFEKAQKEFYKDKELKNVKASAAPLKNKYKNKTNLKKEIRSRCIRNIKLLNLRANEINAGNINNSRYGHLKYGSTPISQIRSTNQVNNLKAQEIGEFNSNQWRLDQELKIHDFIKGMAVLNNRNHDILKDISRYQLDHYNRSGNDWDKLDLMQAYIHDTYYLASPYAPSGSVLNYGQESYVEWYGREQFPAKLSVFHPDHWKTLLHDASPNDILQAKERQQLRMNDAIEEALNQVSNPDFLAEVAIAGLGARNEEFIKEKPNLEHEVQEYFKVNDFSKVSSDCMNYLLNQLQGGGEFTPNTSLYESAISPLYQNAGNPNRALKWNAKPQAIQEGFTNFGYVLAALFKDNAYPVYEGRIIRDMLSANNRTIPSSFTNVRIGELFSFISPDASQWDNCIYFNNNAGGSLWNQGYNMNDIFSPGLQQEAALAIATFGNEMAQYLEDSNFSEQSMQFSRRANEIRRNNININSLSDVVQYLIVGNEIFYVDGGSKKVNPARETRCFDITESAKITIYVEQPIRGSREITANIGHTFIGIEQGEISRYLGFYPDSQFATLLKPQKAEIHDNSGAPFDVSISTTVSPEQLKIVIDYINDFPDTYFLNTFNCSDFGIQVGTKCGLNLPRTVGEYNNFLFNFRGRNPADLGEDIREMESTSTIEINRTNGTAPQKQGEC